MDPADAVRDVVDKLSAAGVRAVADERDLNPPCVYVRPASIAWDHLAAYTMPLYVYAVAPNTGRLNALTALGGLAEQVRAVWAVAGGTFEDLTPLDPGDPWPALRMDLTVTVTDD